MDALQLELVPAVFPQSFIFSFPVRSFDVRGVERNYVVEERRLSGSAGSRTRDRAGSALLRNALRYCMLHFRNPYPRQFIDFLGFRRTSASYLQASHFHSTRLLQGSFLARILSPLLPTRRHHSTDETVKVPIMAESISEGTLKQWQKKVGDFVAQDEEVATIETDKVCINFICSPSFILHPQRAPSPNPKCVPSRAYFSYLSLPSPPNFIALAPRIFDTYPRRSYFGDMSSAYSNINHSNIL